MDETYCYDWPCCRLMKEQAQIYEKFQILSKKTETTNLDTVYTKDALLETVKYFALLIYRVSDW